jgi:hypothetical protein
MATSSARFVPSSQIRPSCQAIGAKKLEPNRPAERPYM